MAGAKEIDITMVIYLSEKVKYPCDVTGDDKQNFIIQKCFQSVFRKNKINVKINELITKGN